MIRMSLLNEGAVKRQYYAKEETSMTYNIELNEIKITNNIDMDIVNNFKSTYRPCRLNKDGYPSLFATNADRDRFAFYRKETRRVEEALRFCHSERVHIKFPITMAGSRLAAIKYDIRLDTREMNRPDPVYIDTYEISTSQDMPEIQFSFKDTFDFDDPKHIWDKQCCCVSVILPEKYYLDYMDGCSIYMEAFSSDFPLPPCTVPKS